MKNVFQRMPAKYSIAGERGKLCARLFAVHNGDRPVLLDLVASALSGGGTTEQVGQLPVETGMSQVFVALDVARMPDGEVFAQCVRDTLAAMQKTLTPLKDGQSVHYPGQNMLCIRAENLANGIPVDESVWEDVLKR